MNIAAPITITPKIIIVWIEGIDRWDNRNHQTIPIHNITIALTIIFSSAESFNYSSFPIAIGIRRLIVTNINATINPSTSENAIRVTKSKNHMNHDGKPPIIADGCCSNPHNPSIKKTTEPIN